MKQTFNLRQQLSINLRCCYSSRRATKHMSAIRNSPTIGLNLRALPLSAVNVSLHCLPRCLRSIVKCGKTPATVTWSASSKICCRVIVTEQRPIVEQFAPEFRNLPLQAEKRIKWTESSSLHVTKTVNLTLVQCECHIGKQTVIATINSNNQN